MAVSPGGRPMDSSPFSTSTTSNWVARAGGLPEYVRGVAHALLRKGRARSEAQAIGMAIGLMQDWAAGRTPNGKGHVHPQVQAAAAAALAKWEAMKAAAHSHANEGGAVIALTWNGQSVDLGYMPPHVPAGSPAGGQFGTTSGKGASSGGTAGKTPAQQHADHMAHVAHLQRLVATGKATPAQRKELAGLLKALNAPKGKPKPGTAAATEAAAAAAIAAHPLPDAPAKKAAKPKPKAAGPAKPATGTAATPAKAKPTAPKTTTASGPAATKPKTAAVKPGAGTVKAGTPKAAAPLAPRARKDALHAQASADRVKAAGIDQQVASLNRVIAAQVKATAAAKAARKVAPTAAAKATAALAKAAPKKAGNAATKSSPGAPRRTLARNRATVAALTGKAKALRAQAGALDRQANAIKLSGDGDGMAFLDLAVPGQRYRHGWIKIGTGPGEKDPKTLRAGDRVKVGSGMAGTGREATVISQTHRSPHGTPMVDVHFPASGSPEGYGHEGYGAHRVAHTSVTHYGGQEQGTASRADITQMKTDARAAIASAAEKRSAADAQRVASERAAVTGHVTSARAAMAKGDKAAARAALAKAIAATSDPGAKRMLKARRDQIRLSGDDGRFLDLAIADALTVPGPEVRRLVAPAERVPPGVREGGQFTPRPPQFTRHDTPERAAEVINSMGPAQRARVRATILCPPGHFWTDADKLAVAG